MRYRRPSRLTRLDKPVDPEIVRHFGDAIDLFGTGGAPPKGVESVDVTFSESGPIVVPMETHPSTCGIWAAIDRGEPPAPACTCGWYFPILVPG